MSAALAREELEAAIWRATPDRDLVTAILNAADFYAEEVSGERRRRAAAASAPRVHFDRDGRARCGRRPGVPVTDDEAAVTCQFCINIMTGANGIGARQPDRPHGTTARYRWHLRHEGAPVRCEPCLQAERRRGQDYRRAA